MAEATLLVLTDEKGREERHDSTGVHTVDATGLAWP